jgi:hypothetical protein
MILLRAMAAMVAWLWCRATLLFLDRLDDLEDYAWFESRAQVHYRKVERLMEALR